MKRRLIALLEHLRAELYDVITDVEHDEIDNAIDKTEAAVARLRSGVEEIRR